MPFGKCKFELWTLALIYPFQDRRPISTADLIEPTAATIEIIQGTRERASVEQVLLDESDEPSAKIDHLMLLLGMLPKSDKSLVFSSFTSYLDLVATRLKSAG